MAVPKDVFCLFGSDLWRGEGKDDDKQSANGVREWLSLP